MPTFCCDYIPSSLRHFVYRGRGILVVSFACRIRGRPPPKLLATVDHGHLDSDKLGSIGAKNKPHVGRGKLDAL